MLASILFPFDDDAFQRMDGWLSELSSVGAIRLYDVDGTRYLDIPKFLEHQKIDRPSAPKFPGFDEGSRVFDEGSLLEGKGREREKEYRPSDSSPANAVDTPQDRIPYQTIVDQYNEVCGDLFPKVAKVTDKRRKAIKARWLDGKAHGTDSVEYWSKYFSHCRNRVEFFRKAASGELTGQHSGWTPDFEFLMSERGWLGVVEGRYV